MKTNRRECDHSLCMTLVHRGGHVSDDGKTRFCARHFGLGGEFRADPSFTKQDSRTAAYGESVKRCERIDAILRERYPKERARKDAYDARKKALQVRSIVTTMHVARQVVESERNAA